MKYYIGLDIGGTKIKGVLVDEGYKMLKEELVFTEGHKPKSKILQNIFSVIKTLKEGYNISGIGVSIAGYLRRGYLVDSHNIKNLNYTNLMEDFKKNIKEKFIVENDANCFVIAERSAWKKKNMVGIVIGTGIGTGIVIDGRLYTGSIGNTEFGHMIIDPSGPTCSCGKKGDFEAWCSGTSILNRYKKLGGKLKSAEEIFKSKDKIQKKVIDETYKYLGIGLANVVTVLNPDLVVLGGGISNDLDYPRLNREVKKNVVHELKYDVNIVKHQIAHDSGVLGAVMLLKSKVL